MRSSILLVKASNSALRMNASSGLLAGRRSRGRHGDAARDDPRVDRLTGAGNSAEAHCIAIDLGRHEGQIGIEAPGCETRRAIDVSLPELTSGSRHKVGNPFLGLRALVEVVVSAQDHT